MIQELLEPMILDWVFGVQQLAAVATNYPQTAYVRMVVNLQAEERPYLEILALAQQQMFVTFFCQSSLFLQGTQAKQHFGVIAQVCNSAAMLDLHPTLDW